MVIIGHQLVKAPAILVTAVTFPAPSASIGVEHLNGTIVNYSGGTEFEVQARGHRVVCDQPAENGGADAGMTPPEFLLASLGTCAAFYAAQYLRTRSLPPRACKFGFPPDKAAGPARLAAFRIEIRVPASPTRSTRRACCAPQVVA